MIGSRTITRIQRRGGSTAGILALVAAFGTIGVAAFVVGPRFLHAGEEQQVIFATDPAHQEMIEVFAGILARSRAVIALHERGATPFEELVLWVVDTENPGVIDPHEVVVISHSKVLHTLTYFGREKADQAIPLVVDDLQKPVFCDLWRTNPGVEVKIIGGGISDVAFSQQGMIQDGRALLRITFTWASDSVDAPDEASVLVDVVMQSTTIQE